jgi:hypothetical protein
MNGLFIIGSEVVEIVADCHIIGTARHCIWTTRCTLECSSDSVMGYEIPIDVELTLWKVSNFGPSIVIQSRSIFSRI